MEIDEVPVVAKAGGMYKDKSSDPVENIAEAESIYLSGYQADQLRLENGDIVDIYLPDVGTEYTGVVTNYSYNAKQVRINSHHTLALTTEEAEAAAFPDPDTIRDWNRTTVEEADRKSTWRKYVDEVPPETLFKIPLEPGA